ncbi:hypothetical protein PybrP1_006796 [[Pythium] brassicae (nom. inval.)]|nr:hypothetical protein PybrP1_006796 [[Pythium] brassicae (nom. inval.)]
MRAHRSSLSPSQSPSRSLVDTRTTRSKRMNAYVALVIGSTGAVGRDLVAELVASAKCAKVIALTRRDVPASEWHAAFPALDTALAAEKLEVRAVDFEQLSASAVVVRAEEKKVDAAFSCLGTTRKLHDALKGVPYFGLLASTTKGEAEANARELGCTRTSFFRPGLIDRGALMRTPELMASYLLPIITTRAIAKSMVADYESALPGVREWSDSAMKAFEAST